MSLNHYTNPDQLKILEQMMRINHALKQIDLLSPSIPDNLLCKYEEYLNMLHQLGEKLDELNSRD